MSDHLHRFYWFTNWNWKCQGVWGVWTCHFRPYRFQRLTKNISFIHLMCHVCNQWIHPTHRQQFRETEIWLCNLNQNRLYGKSDRPTSSSKKCWILSSDRREAETWESSANRILQSRMKHNVASLSQDEETVYQSMDDKSGLEVSFIIAGQSWIDSYHATYLGVS